MANQSESKQMLSSEDNAQIEQIVSNAVNRRILRLQEIDDFSGGVTTLLRSTQSTTCSSASTGGCTIRDLAAATS